MQRPVRTATRVLATLACASLFAFSGCKSDDSSSSESSTPPASTSTAKVNPGPVTFTNEYTATYSVTAIDTAKRLVTVRRENGSLIDLKVAPEARNFEQLEVGDRVRVRYAEKLSVSKRPAGDSVRPTEAAVGSGRTELGDKPGGGVGMAMSVRAKIESIDMPNGIVVFSLASRELITHRIATPEGRAFAAGLHVGDVVQIDYAEGVALTVDEI